MLHPSKRLLFAIESVLDIAYHGGSQPVQSGDISTRQGIPRRYLEQVLQHLVRTGILAGHRGPRGGYLLGRERRRITVLNSPGTIDADYRGEVGVILINLGQASFTINRGERIAQMVMAPISRLAWREQASELAATARGEGGFGSTGHHAPIFAQSTDK